MSERKELKIQSLIDAGEQAQAWQASAAYSTRMFFSPISFFQRSLSLLMARENASAESAQDVKPLAGTEWCEAPHFQYHVSGRLGIKMSTGEEMEAVPGDVTALPQGHDAWVIGDEPVVVVDWWGASNYAQPS